MRDKKAIHTTTTMTTIAIRVAWRRLSGWRARAVERRRHNARARAHGRQRRCAQMRASCEASRRWAAAGDDDERRRTAAADEEATTRQGAAGARLEPQSPPPAAAVVVRRGPLSLRLIQTAIQSPAARLATRRLRRSSLMKMIIVATVEQLDDYRAN